jgi:hypothetical protein
MDDELDEAQNLTLDELVVKLRNGRPTDLDRTKSRSRDLNRRAASIVNDATNEPPQGVRLEPGGPRVTIIRLTERPGSDPSSFPTMRRSAVQQTIEVTEQS